MIQQLAEANPQLAQGLAQNPELLYQMFSQGAAGLEGGEEGEFPPGAQVIQVTAEERDAIARVGFHCCSPHQHFLICHIVGGSWLSPAGRY
jgi:hypothetical protein